ncbi:MAG: rhodanese-like domain-containing protein [Bacteroidota bacterium]
MKKTSNIYYLFFAYLFLNFLPQCSRDTGVVQDVSPAEAFKMTGEKTSNPAITIIDVRTAEEFSSGHIAGAINIDFQSDEFEANIGKLDKNRSYLVYCHSGHRSSGAASMMKKMGFKSIKNLGGGIARWTDENLPVVVN